MGGHIHVRVEGSPTKPSAIYVDVDGLAWHIGLAFHKSLGSLDAQERISPNVAGLESVAANDIMLTSKREVVRAWFWKRVAHINVLEPAAVVSNLGTVARSHVSVRFASFLDSAVCCEALAKGSLCLICLPAKPQECVCLMYCCGSLSSLAFFTNQVEYC